MSECRERHPLTSQKRGREREQERGLGCLVETRLAHAQAPPPPPRTTEWPSIRPNGRPFFSKGSSLSQGDGRRRRCASASARNHAASAFDASWRRFRYSSNTHARKRSPSGTAHGSAVRVKVTFPS